MKGRKPLVEIADVVKSKKSKVKNRLRIEEIVKVSKDNLTCPKDLSDGAKEEWRKLMRTYRKMDHRILSDLDIPALSTFCESWACFAQARNEWKEHGCRITSLDPDEQRQLDRIIVAMQKYGLMIAKLNDGLCLSPVGRTRMAAYHANEGAQPENQMGAMEAVLAKLSTK